MHKINLTTEKDIDLVKLALTDQDNFVYIIEKYEKPLFRYVRRFSSFPSEDIEDLLQEVFIKVYKNLNGFDKSLKFSSWIYRITHNEVISHYRKIKVRPKTFEGELNDEILDNIKSDFSLEDILEKKLTKELVKELLAQMDVKYREVLVLRYLEEKDYSEISDILKKPKGTVATLLNRAKKQMLEIYRKYEQSKK